MVIPNNGSEEFLSIILRNEKKIERVLRSKSRLDSLFELCPMSPWRETSCLKSTCGSDQIITNLDFTNFYPSILISEMFPDPKDLWHTYPKTLPKEPGILRAILHPKSSISEKVRHHHPFQLQIDKISCPFYIEGRIETLLHTNEIGIWSEFFEIEPLEAILSNQAITHPLKNRVNQALEEIDVLKKDRERNNKKIAELKLIVNSATTTPKINQDRNLPSKYGVHCLSSQIVSNARAKLFQTIQACLGTKDELLQVNTDGFIAKTEISNPIIHKIKEMSLWGDRPGLVREKCHAKSGLFLGANTWWLVGKEGELVDEAGTGRDKSQLHTYKNIPKYLEYMDNKNQIQRINLLYLSDFRHKLDHQTLKRKKFVLSQEGIFSAQAPWLITHREKNRSWIVTKKTWNKFSKEFKAKISQSD